MPPAYVGAGAGTVITTGTGTVSKTSCVAGNLILIHFMVAGVSEDYSAPASVNLSDFTGAAGYHAVRTGSGIGSPETRKAGLLAARATANGTCSFDFTVGASGEDIFARMYEVSDENTGTTVAEVLEEGASTSDAAAGTGTTVATTNDFTTNGSDRLGLQLVSAAVNTTITEFSGEGGGIDFTEALAEYSEAGGVTGTLSLQIANITNAVSNLNTGTATLGASTGWNVIYLAVIPSTAPSTATLRTVSSGLRW